MIELFVFLFVLQGDTPSEWLESCNTDFIDYIEKISERNPDVLFCKYVKDLDLTVNDIEKLGKEFNWLNYVMISTNEYIEDWGFYQESAIKDTLVIWPSISTRDSLPPAMKVQISFDYKDGDIISKFDESFQISPLCDPPISPDGICNLKEILDISSPNFSSQYEMSLKQQIDNNFSFNEILCPDNDHVLAQRTNGKLSCVYSETADKLNWTIRDKEVKVNLLLNNDPAVKDCVPKKEGDVYPTMPYRNSTHSFDPGVCEWNVRELFYHVEKDDMIFDISYTIKGGTIDGMGSDDDADSLLMSIDSNADFGEMSVSIPKEFFNYYSDDHIFSMFVLENQEEILRTEIIDEENIFLKFNFTQTDPIIEIIYTFLP